MTLSAYLTVLMLNLVGSISPGPDTVLVTRLATKSRRHAVAAALGVQTGALCWFSLTVFGAATVLSTFPEILGAVQIVGGSFLIYMGSRLVRGGLIQRKYPPASLEEVQGVLGRPIRSYRAGVACNLSNPKIVLFLASLIAPLLPAHAGIGASVTLIAGLSLTSVALFLTLAVVVSTAAVRRRLLKAGPGIDIGSGAFFVVAGAALVIAGVTSFI